jgi:hypothetical protein
MCDCLKITYVPFGGGVETILEITTVGTHNGFNYFEYTIDGIDYTLFHDPYDHWYVTTDGFSQLEIICALKSGEPCPLASVPAWIVGEFYDVFTTELCDECGCGIDFKITNPDSQIFNLSLDATANIVNAKNTYIFSGDIGFGLEDYVVYFNGTTWVVEGSVTGEIFVLYSNADCPFGNWQENFRGYYLETKAADCPDCSNEDRIFRQYSSIKLPQSFVEQDRGLVDCCCVQLVLGGVAETWQNDLTSMWIKLSDELDNFRFLLLDCDQNPIMQLDSNPFPNEENAYYSTVDWGQILSIFGQGNYSLGIAYDIAGVAGLLLWGDYRLLPYTIQNALKTARVRAIFNGKQTIDGIDFTNSNVESTHRFYGYIGNRQPNMEIDNIIYDNREMKRVIRENLNDYEIITDPEDECILRPLLELYLISENELFISDYNAHNHSYRYLDLPVIVSESPSVEYKDFSRKAVLKCKVADKFKNSRTFY